MAKLKDMLGIETIVDKKMAVVKADLYKAIKELSEMQYKIVELETALANTDAMLKLVTKGG